MKLGQADQGRRMKSSTQNQKLKLLLFASTAIPVTMQTSGVQSRVLTLHTDGVALPEVLHPVSVRVVAVRAVWRDGHKLEFNTVPATKITK